MFQRILVPVDFTPKNKRALQTAQDLAAHHGGKLTLLHVIEKVQHLPQSELQSFYRQLKRQAERNLAKLLVDCKKKGVPATGKIMMGNRTEKVVAQAKQSRADLVLMSSHKVTAKNKGSGWGTISYKVALLATCPVLLVK